MRNYYEKGDKVKLVLPEESRLSYILKEYSYKDPMGRAIIIENLYTNPQGTVKAVKEGTGHLEVLYQPKGKTHSWWLPTSIIKPLNN